jgi:hypothetical protein
MTNRFSRNGVERCLSFKQGLDEAGTVINFAQAVITDT